MGRIFAVDIINGGYAPKAEDVEQVKAVYGDSVNPDEVYYIRFNTTDKKKMAQAIYDKFRQYLREKRFANVTDKDLILEHASRWFKSIPDAEKMPNVVVIKRQLELCLQRIDDGNKDEHKPFMDLSYMPLDDDNIVAGMDCYGYAAEPIYRLNDDDFKNMMEAFDRWVKHENIELEEELPITEKLKSIFHNDMTTLRKFLQRTKGKQGARIVDHVKVLIEMGRIDEEEAGEDLRKELESLGYKTTTKQNWSDQIGKKRRAAVVEKIKSDYQFDAKRAKE